MARIDMVSGWQDGDLRFSYKWVGGPTERTFISYEFSEYIADLPWRLTLVEECPQMQGAYYVRTDGKYSISAFFHKVRYGLRRCTDGFMYRVVRTAEIWGLVRLTPGEQISWSSLWRRHD